ncbi:hypothetical protein A7X67_02820 [Clostridium sp. W14A]|nr:hypothetical protein A7X67_02820 [Clostridium sp. W14A]
MENNQLFEEFPVQKKRKIWLNRRKNKKVLLSSYSQTPSFFNFRVPEYGSGPSLPIQKLSSVPSMLIMQTSKMPKVEDTLDDLDYAYTEKQNRELSKNFLKMEGELRKYNFSVGKKLWNALQKKSEVSHIDMIIIDGICYLSKNKIEIGTVCFKCDSSGKPTKNFTERLDKLKVPYLIFEKTESAKKSTAVVLAYGNIGEGIEKASDLIRNVINANKYDYVNELLDGLKLCGGSCYISSVNALLFFEQTVPRAFKHEVGHSKQSEQLGEMATSLDELNKIGIRALDLHNVLFTENQFIRLEPPEDMRQYYLKITLTGKKPYYIRVEYAQAVRQATSDASLSLNGLKKITIVIQEAQKNANPFFQQIFYGIAITIQDIADKEKKHKIESIEFYSLDNCQWTSYRDNLKGQYLPGLITADVLNCLLKFIDRILNDIGRSAISISQLVPHENQDKILQVKRLQRSLKTRSEKIEELNKSLKSKLDSIEKIKNALKQQTLFEKIEELNKSLKSDLASIEKIKNDLKQNEFYLTQTKQELKTKESECKSAMEELEKPSKNVRSTVDCARILQEEWQKIKAKLNKAATTQSQAKSSPPSPPHS